MAPDTIQTAVEEDFIVGGVKLPRPFRIRRLGHFGLDIQDPEAGRRFYEGLLGLRTSDILDMGARLTPEQKASVGPTVGYFSRHGTDHHSFVWFPRRARQAMMPDAKSRGDHQPDHLAGRLAATRWLRASRGAASTMFASAAPGATRRAPTGTSIRSIPKATPTSSITASSRSAGTASASRARCTRSPTTSRPICRTAPNTRKWPKALPTASIRARAGAPRRRRRGDA